MPVRRLGHRLLHRSARRTAGSRVISASACSGHDESRIATSAFRVMDNREASASTPRRKSSIPRLTSHWVDVESFQYLGHPSPADAKMAGKCGPALELARVKDTCHCTRRSPRPPHVRRDPQRAEVRHTAFTTRHMRREPCLGPSVPNPGTGARTSWSIALARWTLISSYKAMLRCRPPPYQ